MFKIKYNKDICRETDTAGLVFIGYYNTNNPSKHIKDAFLLEERLEMNIEFLNSTLCNIKIIFISNPNIGSSINWVDLYLTVKNEIHLNSFRFTPVGKVKVGRELEGLFEICKSQCLK